MPAFGASDVQAMLDTFGVPVVLGAVTAKGIFDNPEAVLEGSPDMAAARPTVLVKTGTFPALATGADLTVDGEAFKVAGFHRVEDGATTIIDLAKVL